MKKFFRKFAKNETFDDQGRAKVTGRHIYILPTRYGLMLGVLLILMLIGSLNYANNPAYLLTFFLISLSLNSMYQTWRNLRHVQIESLNPNSVFCGDKLALRFKLKPDSSIEKPAIQINLENGQAVVYDLLDSQDNIYTINHTTNQRGYLKPKTLSLSTRYPLGLFRAWCYIENLPSTIIYPKLVDTTPLLQAHNHESKKNSYSHKVGNDDFLQLRKYQLGDSPSHIDWKSLAKYQNFMSKQFCSEKDNPLIINWADFNYPDIELRLSMMATAIVTADKLNQPYSLQLPSLRIDQAIGPAHRHQCLSALACFNQKVSQHD